MDPRLDYLLQRYFDGELDPSEKQDLQELLLSNPRARTEFWRAARVHSSLRLWGEENSGRKAARQHLAAASGAKAAWNAWREAAAAWLGRPWVWGTGLAAVAVVVAATLFLIRPHRGPQGGQVAGNQTQRQPAGEAGLSAAPDGNPFTRTVGIAVLKHVADAVWEKGAREFQPGDTLVPGWLRLRSGAVQIEFSRGARVLLEGPAEFELVSSAEGRLKSGRLRAQVAGPAGGFRITSAAFELVDHGTDFGCQVPTQGVPEVFVFKGEVEVAPRQAGQAKRSLTANQAVAVTTSGLSAIAFNRAAFLGEAELARREESDFTDRLANWRRNSQQLSARSGVLLHYTFEGQQPWERTLHNRAQNAPPATDATLVGCDWTQGRWPGKGALEFIRSDDRIRVNVPGEFQCLTYLAWLRVDSLPNHYSSLAVTESLEVGEVHWALTQEGGLLLGARKSPPTSPADWSSHTKLAALKPEMLGAWVLLASVYDTRTATVTHYVNGQQVALARVEAPSMLRLGNLEIGNWGVRADDPRWARLQQAGSVVLNRSFKGRMDEFALFTTPLSAEEIRALYEYGKPASTDSQLVGLPRIPKTN